MKYFLSIILVIAAKLSLGQWNNSPSVNNVVTNVAGFQGGHSIITDNRGGAIVAWYQNEANGTDNSIYVQRIDANGNLKWGSSGLLICSTNGYRYFPQLYPDGTGGAVVGWTDLRNGKTDVLLGIIVKLQKKGTLDSLSMTMTLPLSQLHLHLVKLLIMEQK